MTRFHGHDATNVAKSMIKSNGFDGALKGCDTIIHNCEQRARQHSQASSQLRHNQYRMRAKNYRDVRAVVDRLRRQDEINRARAEHEASKAQQDTDRFNEPDLMDPLDEVDLDDHPWPDDDEASIN